MAVLYFNAQTNTYSVTQEGRGMAPITDPLNNLPYVKWHASLPYVGMDHHRVSVDLRMSTWTTEGRVLGFPMLAHGKPFRPLIIGVAWIAGKPVPLQGGVVVAWGGTRHSGSLYIVNSDETYVRLENFGDFDDVYASDTLVSPVVDFDLYICNFGLDANGGAVTPPKINGLEATPTRFRCGQFDTINRYLSQDDLGDLRIYTDASIGVEVYNFLGLTQNVGAYWVTSSSTQPPTFFSPQSVRAKVD